MGRDGGENGEMEENKREAEECDRGICCTVLCCIACV